MAFGNPEQTAVQRQPAGHSTRMKAKAKTDKSHKKGAKKRGYGKRMG
jgi:hypothetical protein